MSDGAQVAAIFQVGAPGKRAPPPRVSAPLDPSVSWAKIPSTFPRSVNSLSWLSGTASLPLALSLPSPLAWSPLFFHYFSAFSPANVSVSSSSLRLSSLVSAGGALIHSVPSRLRSPIRRYPLSSSPLLHAISNHPLSFSPLLSPGIPRGASLSPLLRVSHSTSSSFVSPSAVRPLSSLSLILGKRERPGTQLRELKYIVILILLTPL